MKVLKIVGLLALGIMNFSSCDLFLGHDEPEFVIYNLGLSFQDASGNDLVKGIGLEEWSFGMSMEDALWGAVKPDLYLLDVILSEPCKNWDNDIYNAPARPGFIPDVNRPKLGMERSDRGDCYLTNSFRLPVSDCPEEKVLTYKLKCLYLFGDEEVHEFVTYWNIPKSNRERSFERYAKCYRIEFEGNKITPRSPTDEHRNYEAVIMLTSVQE